jgi:hypothetical protein
MPKVLKCSYSAIACGVVVGISISAVLACVARADILPSPGMVSDLRASESAISQVDA